MESATADCLLYQEEKIEQLLELSKPVFGFGAGTEENGQ